MVNFNRIAPFYDTLSKIVFGNTLLKASNCFIHKLPEHATVLYIGGGSGSVLKEIVKLNPKSKIDFIEASEKFISIAKTKLNPDLFKHVHFIHGNENQIAPDKKYNSVITFFVVDLFRQKEAEEFCSKIISHLEPGGIWLFVDFISPKNLYQKLLLKFMYCFFRVAANIPATQLPDYNLIFQQLNMQVEISQMFYNEMICSKVLQKL